MTCQVLHLALLPLPAWFCPHTMHAFMQVAGYLMSDIQPGPSLAAAIRGTIKLLMGVGIPCNRPYR